MSVSSVLRHEMSAPVARPRFADVAAENLDGVHRYLCHLTGDRDLADDLTSATFERALRDWARYDPARGRPSVWLVEVARRVALDHFRKDGRRRAREERYAAGVPASVPGPSEPGGFSTDLRAALVASLAGGAGAGGAPGGARHGRRRGGPGRRHVGVGGRHGAAPGPDQAATGGGATVTTPGGIGPERLGEIVDGAAPRDDEERALLALMEETRALEPGASEELRRRVLDGPPPRPVSRAASLRRRLGAAAGRRRLVAVGAPVAAGLVALAIAIPVLDDGGPPSAAPGSADTPASVEGATSVPEAERLDRDSGAAESAPAAGAAPAGTAPPAAAALAPGAQAPAPAPGRARKVTAETRVQVEDVEALSRASTSAMRTVRSLGGFTASSDYDVPSGAEGTNRLVFRVPVDRAEDALAAFGRLGVVTGQSADIVDLTARIGTQTDRVDALRATVGDLRARAAADPPDAGLAAELARAEASLRRAEAARAATGRADPPRHPPAHAHHAGSAPADHRRGALHGPALPRRGAARRRDGLAARSAGAGRAVRAVRRRRRMGRAAPARPLSPAPDGLRLSEARRVRASGWSPGPRGRSRGGPADRSRPPRASPSAAADRRRSPRPRFPGSRRGTWWWCARGDGACGR